MLVNLQYILWILFTIWTSLRIQSCNCMKKTIEYTIIKITSLSTDPTIVDFDIRANRISRGVYGMHGNITVGEGVDNDFMAGVSVWQNAEGGSSYQYTPFGLPLTPLYDFLSIYYKRFVMESLKDCSNLLQFKDRYDQPIPSKVYTMNNCLFDKLEFPAYSRPGYYKVVIFGKRRSDSNFNAEVIVFLKLEEMWV